MKDEQIGGDQYETLIDLAIGPEWATYSHNVPRRTTEVWKLDVETASVSVLGPDGIFRLNQLGALLWLRFDGNYSVSDLCQELATLYPSEPSEQIAADVLAFVDSLQTKRLLVSSWDPLNGVVPQEAFR